MPNPLDPETLKIPAFMRKKAIVSQAKQKLILTALDRKEAGLSPNSHKATAPVKSSRASRYNQILNQIARNRKKPALSKTPRAKSYLSRADMESVQTRPRRRYNRKSTNFDSASALSALNNDRGFIPPLINTNSQHNFSAPLIDVYPEIETGNSNYDYDQEQSVPTFPQNFLLAGTVTHYLNKINVAIIKLTAPLKIGDLIYIQTENGLTLQQIEEMQIERRPVLRAKQGSHIGLKVKEPALIEGKIFKVQQANI